MEAKEIELNLNEFDFQGVVLEDLQKYIVEETDLENLFCFFMELFSYCRQVGFQFEKTREIAMISFVLEHLDEITGDAGKAKRLLVDYIVYYILDSENLDELIGLFTLIETPYLYYFIKSLEHWKTLHHRLITDSTFRKKIKKIQEELFNHIHMYSSM